MGDLLDIIARLEQGPVPVVLAALLRGAARGGALGILLEPLS